MNPAFVGNVLYPEHAVVIPRPEIHRPVGLAVQRNKGEWVRLLDRFLDFEEMDGTLQQLRESRCSSSGNHAAAAPGILGRGRRHQEPEVSLLRVTRCLALASLEDASADWKMMDEGVKHRIRCGWCDSILHNRFLSCPPLRRFGDGPECGTVACNERISKFRRATDSLLWIFFQTLQDNGFQVGWDSVSVCGGRIWRFIDLRHHDLYGRLSLERDLPG